MLDSLKTLFTREQVEGFVRHALTTVGGLLLGNGLLDAGLWEAIVGAAVTGAGVAWSWWAKRPGKIPPAATALPTPPAAPQA